MRRTLMRGKLRLAGLITSSGVLFGVFLTASLCASCSRDASTSQAQQQSSLQASPQSSASAASSVSNTQVRSFPIQTPRIDTVDSYHGTDVVDPYRWLEDDSDEEKAWTEAQNQFSRSVFDAIPGRGRIQTEVEKLMTVDDISAPVPRKTKSGAWRYFFSRRSGAQNQPTLMIRDGVKASDGAPLDRVVLDVNDMASDGSIAVDWYYPSRNGRYLAYGLSKDGTEDSTLHIREIGAGGVVRELADRIPRTRFCSLAWKPDGSGFFYSRHPQRGEVPDGEEGYHRKIFEHKLGQPFEQDAEIFGSNRDMTDSPSVGLSPDGRWLVVTVHQGWAKAELYLRDLSVKDGEFLPVAVGKEATYTPIVTNNAIFVHTNEDAPRGRLLRVDPKHPSRDNWKEVIPEGQHTLEDVTLIGGQLIAGCLKDAASKVMRYDLDGKLLGEIELPVLGTASVRGAQDGTEVFVGFHSFAVRKDIYRVSL
ncbi:MAG: hypothetical protein FWD57_07845, partial [Polyangiaceae bacterium]|nr:hypothetical protein [Polyangiaceae bacterium]